MTIGAPQSTLPYDLIGYSMQIFSRDCVILKFVLTSPQPCILYLLHYTRLGSNPSKYCMYDTVRYELYWSHMVNDAYTNLKGSGPSDRNQTWLTYMKLLKLISASWPLEFVAMDVLGPLQKTKNGNPFVVVITEHYLKLTQTIPTAEITAAHVSFMFFDYNILLYRAPDHLLMDNRSQLVAKFFRTICSFLEVKHLKTTAYRPHTKSHPEQHNKTIILWLRHCVGDNQRDGFIYFQPLTYRYSTQTHRLKSTRLLSIILLLRRWVQHHSMTTQRLQSMLKRLWALQV